jgi:flagellum-specific ATP synthase
VPGCNNAEENALVRRARAILATWADMADLVRLGAYRVGTDPVVDEAVKLAPRIEALLCQEKQERSDLAASFAGLRTVLAPA